MSGNQISYLSLKSLFTVLISFYLCMCDLACMHAELLLVYNSLADTVVSICIFDVQGLHGQAI